MSSERNASGVGDASGQWERVALELRACKETQQKAWGSIDNTTLGRYLAGEASECELAEVETALQELPELRKLTDLVRDVLNDLEPVVFHDPTPEPVLLSLPSQPAMPRRRFAALLRRRAPLVAAACLLLTFGLAMPGSGFLSAPIPREMPRLNDGVALARPRAALAAPGAAGKAGEAVPEPRDAFEPDPHQDRGNAFFTAPPDSRAQGDANTPGAAAEVNRRGLMYRSRGDLVRAVPLQHRAHRMCEQKLGPNHPTTRKTVCELARVYQVALNAPPPPLNRPYHMAGITGVPPRSPAAGFLPLYQNAAILRQQIEDRSTQEVQSAVVPVLARALQTEPSGRERVNLVRALGSLGPAAGNAVGVLTERLKNSRDPAEVRVVLDALNEIGPAARDALPVLAVLSHQCCEHPPGSARRPKGKESRPQSREELTARFTPGDEKHVRLVYASLNGPAGRTGVDDRAGYFSVRAVCQANRTIRELAKKAHAEVLIETAGPSASKECSKDGKSNPSLRTPGRRTLHVVFARDGTVRVLLSNALRSKDVTPTKIRTRLEECARRRQYDKALEEGIKIVRTIAAK